MDKILVLLKKSCYSFLIVLLSLNAMAESRQKSLNFKKIVHSALKNSPTYQSIEAQSQEVNIPVYKAKSSLSPTLNVKIGTTDNNNEQVTHLRPKRSQGTLSEIEMSKYFRTGTALSVGMKINKRNNTFLDDPIIQDRVISDPYYESIGVVSIKQNLWKDAFGYSVRKSLESAQKMKQSKIISLKDDKEKWLLNIAKLYDAVILSHLQYETSIKDLHRKKRLHQIVKKQKKRGAAESTDIIESEAALMYSEQDVIEKKYAWRKSWLTFKNYVGLSHQWTYLDPDEISLEPPKPLGKAVRLCHSEKSTENNKFQKGIALKREASELSVKATKNSLHPDLSIEAQLKNNGIDLAGIDYANKEVFQFNHPMWYLGIALKWDFDSYKEKAKLAEVKAQTTKIQALEKQNKDQLNETWSIHCDEVKSLQKKISSFKKMNKKLSYRLNIEEKKFKSGYIPVIKVIRAGSDYSKSILSIHLAEAQLRKVSWNIQYLSGEVSTYLDGLQSSGSAL